MEWFSLPLLLVVFAGFLLSTLSGLGGSSILVPCLACFYPPEIAVVVSAPIMMIHSFGKSVVFFRSMDWRTAGIMLLGTIPGAYLGARLLLILPTDIIKFWIAIFIFFGLFLQAFNNRQFKIDEIGLGFGALTYGICSGISGTGGPVKALFLSAYGLTKESFVSTAALISLASSVIRIFTYHETGVFPSEAFNMVICLSAVAFFAIFVGKKMLERMKAPRFRRILEFVLVSSAFKIMLF